LRVSFWLACHWEALEGDVQVEGIEWGWSTLTPQFPPFQVTRTLEGDSSPQAMTFSCTPPLAQSCLGSWLVSLKTTQSFVKGSLLNSSQKSHLPIP
jgi:hypothetical protein